MLDRIADIINRTLWRPDPARLTGMRRAVLQAGRVAQLLYMEVTEGTVSLQAMSLVYTTLLSLVPLLAVSFSVLQAFGVHNLIEPLLTEFMEPLGPKGEELTDRILIFVENVNVGVLGSMGLALLVYTVVSLIQKVEDAFNSGWHVVRPRSFTRRFSDYLSVLLIGPVLVFAALGLTASVTNSAVVQAILEMEPFGTLLLWLGQLVPYVIIIGAFTFLYMFVPNTNVRISSALAGAAVAGIAWQTTGYAFASFAAGSTKYDAIYSSFAILILFMIWLYVSWLIVLLGGRVAFYYQHPEQIRSERSRHFMSNRERETLGLMVMYLIVGAFYRESRPWGVDSLVEEIGLPHERISEVLNLLVRRGFVAATDAEEPRYLPARPPENVTLAGLLEALRHAGEDLSGESGTTAREVEAVIADAEQQLKKAMGRKTLKDLVGEDVSPIP